MTLEALIEALAKERPVPRPDVLHHLRRLASHDWGTDRLVPTKAQALEAAEAKVGELEDEVYALKTKTAALEGEVRTLKQELRAERRMVGVLKKRGGRG